jgi:hypothetical protein
MGASLPRPKRIEEDLPLLGRQVVQELPEIRLPAEQGCDGGSSGLPVGDHVLQMDVLPFPDRRLERERRPGRLLEGFEVLDGQSELGGDLGQLWRASPLLGEPLPRAPVLPQRA